MEFNIKIHIGKSQTTPNELLSRISWNRLKAIVKKRDNVICWVCGEKDENGTADHLKPLSKGGTDTLDNLAWICNHCNSQRGNREIDEFLEQQPTPHIRRLGLSRRLLSWLGELLLGGDLPDLLWLSEGERNDFWKLVEERKKQKVRSWLRCQIWENCALWESDTLPDWLPKLKEWPNALEWDDSVFEDLED